MTFRTTDEIILSYQDNVALSDDTADATKGPLYSLVARPMAAVLSPTEQKADNLSQLNSAAFAKTATDEQAQAFLDNWSQAPDTGKFSRVRVYFMKFSRPKSDEIIVVDAGKVVSNTDSSLQYRVVESGSIVGASADSYFNPSRRSYEIGLLVEAVAPGPQYDLPNGRVSNIVTPITGIDAAENRVSAVGGISAESIVSQIERVQEKFQGMDSNTPLGGVARVQAFNPTQVKDVKIVLSNNRKLFRRDVVQPAIDYYILGESQKLQTETYVALGGETLVPIVNVPSLAISNVLLNSVPLSNFTLLPDTQLSVGGSARAEDKLMLATALLPGDTVTFDNTYDELVATMQSNLFTETKLYNTDELARRLFRIAIVMEFDVQSMPSYDAQKVKLAVLAQLQAIIEPGLWVGEFDPKVVTDNVKANVPGVSLISVKRFRRSTLANSEIETVVLEDNEVADYDETVTTVNVKGS